jgi:hypothetical protein
MGIVPLVLAKHVALADSQSLCRRSTIVISVPRSNVRYNFRSTISA